MTQNKLKRLKATQNNKKDSSQTLGLTLDEYRIGFDSKHSKTLIRTDLTQLNKGDWVFDEFKIKTSN